MYAPLAHRLGIHALKWELEDLSFQTLHPRKYAEIKAMVADQQRRPRGAGRPGRGDPRGGAAEANVPAEITARAKHLYSIYDKMAKRGREFNEIYDLTAMRVVCEQEGEEEPATATPRSSTSTRCGSRSRGGSRTSWRCRS